MPKDCIRYQESGYFSPLIHDYLDQKSKLRSAYHRFPTLVSFKDQLLEKQNNFKDSHRKVLSTVLQEQYKNCNCSQETKLNIEALINPNTFTVTTGHQLNLFTGPLYFLYKIISTINLTQELKKEYPEYNFVPIYWMATEDHDFEEINYFTLKGKKIHWNTESKGPVGRLSTKGLEDVFDVFSKEIGTSTNANEIKKLFKDAYLNHNNLTDATRFITNSLFSSYGLVIIDADNPTLKQEFIPYIKEELLHQSTHKLVVESIQNLKDYSIQVKPREINLFYIKNDLRERIILENDIYKVNNTSIQFSREEILAEVEKRPENFSPNVILRPLYQEVILPNLCYIGGGGELAYWLELKSVFDNVKITFPMLLLRNSALLVTEKQLKKVSNLNLNWKDLFLKQNDLIDTQTKLLSKFPIDLSNLKVQLQKQFEYLDELANKTDQSFSGAVKAQEAKQIKGLNNLEKRLLKAQKRKLQNELERITQLQNELFPNKGLQERQTNFSEFYLENGSEFIEKIVKALKPLENNFSIINLFD